MSREASEFSQKSKMNKVETPTVMSCVLEMSVCLSVTQFLEDVKCFFPISF